MSCLNDLDIGTGLIIEVSVFMPGSYTPGTPINLAPHTFSALIDTGASITCISRGVVQAIGLKTTGKCPVASATQIIHVNQYLIDLLLPLGNPGHLIASLPVIELPSVPGSREMLIGRDIIGRGTLVISSDGHFTFCI